MSVGDGARRSAAGRNCFDRPGGHVCADDAFRALAATAIEHQEVVADLVERIEVAAPRRHLRRRVRCHLFVKNPIAKRQRGVDLGGAFGQPNLEVAGNDLDDLCAGSGSA